MTAELDLTAAIAAANAVLANEGADSEDGFHSWRCFDKLRYPEDCTCTYDVTAAALAAALPHIREALTQQATHEPTAQQYADALAATYQNRTHHLEEERTP